MFQANFIFELCLCLLKRQTFNNKNLPISELCIKWNLALEDSGSSLNSPSYCGTLGQLLNMSSTFLIYKIEHSSYHSPMYLMGTSLQIMKFFPIPSAMWDYKEKSATRKRALTLSWRYPDFQPPELWKINFCCLKPGNKQTKNPVLPY